MHRRWILIAVVAAVVIVAVAARARDTQERGTISGRAFGACVDAYADAGSRAAGEHCPPQHAEVMRNQYNRLLACHRQSPTLDAPFYDCVQAERLFIVLP